MGEDIERLLKKAGGIRLDIGCGKHKQSPNWIGMDIQPFEGVDIVHDFNIYPWPLPDESCLLAMASHVIEHIPPTAIRTDGSTWFPFIAFMDEVWRVLKYDAKFIASMPYGGTRGYWQDPTHINGCNEVTWLYFDPLEEKSGGLLYSFYQPKPWKVEQVFTDQIGNMEVALIKRREDPSYYTRGVS